MLNRLLKKVIVYGSYARGDYQKNSDIDIMILVDADETEIKKDSILFAIWLLNMN